MNVAVVGAGIAGLSAARVLAERGHAVALFEQFPLGHDRGSSHGASRIVRRAYPDAFYTACMAEAYPLWRDLERASGRRLLHECGLLYFGDASSPALRATQEGLASLGVPHEALDAAGARRVFPDLRLESHEIGIWTPEAGWADAPATLTATLDLALTAGARVEPRRVTRAELETSYEAFVVCTGPWIRDFVPAPVRITQQTFAYVQAKVDGPVWIEDSPDLAYGFPSDSQGLKIGVHRPGPVIDPGEPSREPNPEDLTIIREVAQRRFGLAEPDLQGAKGCLYTNAPNEDFLLGRLDDQGFFASPCSGHGFKFGPWIGRLLADFVDGRDAPENHPRFYRAIGD